MSLTPSEAGRHFEDRGEKVETMYGVTHETGPLSLLGAFPLGSGTYKTGALRRRIYADAAIWWGHFDQHTRFRRLVFEANNLQEFFQPRGCIPSEEVGHVGAMTKGDDPCTWRGD